MNEDWRTKPMPQKHGAEDWKNVIAGWRDFAVFMLDWIPKAQEYLLGRIKDKRPCEFKMQCHYWEDHSGGFVRFPASASPEYAGKWVECPYWQRADCRRRMDAFRHNNEVKANWDKKMAKLDKKSKKHNQNQDDDFVPA